MNRLDYRKILEVDKLFCDRLDEVTLFFGSINIGTVEHEETQEDVYISIEVWEDEGNALKVVEVYPDGDIRSVEDKIKGKVRKHLIKLIKYSSNLKEVK